MDYFNNHIRHSEITSKHPEDLTESDREFLDIHFLVRPLIDVRPVQDKTQLMDNAISEILLLLLINDIKNKSGGYQIFPSEFHLRSRAEVEKLDSFFDLFEKLKRCKIRVSIEALAKELVDLNSPIYDIDFGHDLVSPKELFQKWSEQALAKSTPFVSSYFTYMKIKHCDHLSYYSDKNFKFSDDPLTLLWELHAFNKLFGEEGKDVSKDNELIFSKGLLAAGEMIARLKKEGEVKRDIPSTIGRKQKKNRYSDQVIIEAFHKCEGRNLNAIAVEIEAFITDHKKKNKSQKDVPSISTIKRTLIKDGLDKELKK